MQQFAYAAFAAAAAAEAAAGSKGSDGGASVGESAAAAGQADGDAFAGNGEDGGKSVSGFVEGGAAQGAPRALAGEATHHGEWGFASILTKIKKIQPDVSMHGRMNAMGGGLGMRTRPGDRVVSLGGDSVRAGKVVDLAPRAQGNRASSDAGLALTKGNGEAGFAMQDPGQYEDRLRTSVQIDVRSAQDSIGAAVDAIQRAASLEISMVLEAMPSARFDNGSVGAVASGGKGGSKVGAITVHDFKDSGTAVLEAVGV